MEEKIIENKVKSILNNLNIRINIKGYGYWIEAVKYVVLNNKITYFMTKEIYYNVAKKMNTTPSRVERALRHAISEKTTEIQKYFNIDYSIRNSTLLALIVDKVRNEAQESL